MSDTPTLASAVRAKYPGAYDDLSDTDLEKMIEAKFPGQYTDFKRTAPKADRAALAANLEAIDPRLAGAARVDDRAAAFAGATPLMLPAALAAKAAAPAIGTALRFSATPGGGALIGAAQGITDGDLVGAAQGAVVGAASGPILGQGAGKLLQFLSRFKRAGNVAQAARTASGSIPASIPPPRSIGSLAPTTATASTEAGAVAGMGLPLTQDEIKILTQLQGHMRTSAGRVAAKEAVKEVFPNNWQEAWKFLTSAHTRVK